MSPIFLSLMPSSSSPLFRLHTLHAIHDQLPRTFLTRPNSLSFFPLPALLAPTHSLLGALLLSILSRPTSSSRHHRSKISCLRGVHPPGNGYNTTDKDQLDHCGSSVFPHPSSPNNLRLYFCTRQQNQPLANQMSPLPPNIPASLTLLTPAANS